jgi:hypothetical protein
MGILLTRGGIIIDTAVTRDILTATLDSGETGITGGGSGVSGTGNVPYSVTVNLDAGVTTRIVTPITTKPYSVFILDSAGVFLDSVRRQELLVGGVYVYDLYSTDALSDVEIRILY